MSGELHDCPGSVLGSSQDMVLGAGRDRTQGSRETEFKGQILAKNVLHREGSTAQRERQRPAERSPVPRRSALWQLLQDRRRAAGEEQPSNPCAPPRQEWVCSHLSVESLGILGHQVQCSERYVLSGGETQTVGCCGPLGKF